MKKPSPLVYLIWLVLLVPGGAVRAEEAAVDWMAIFQAHYRDRVQAFRENNAVLQNIVFLGDSITEGFDLPKYFPGRSVLNRGIGADVIGNNLPEDDQRGVLKRLDSSVYDCAASHVFLLIGANDLNMGRTPDEMEPGYRELLRTIKFNVPRVKVFVQSVLPMSGQHAEKNAAIVEFNRRLPEMARELGYSYLDLHTLMKDERGELRDDFTEDGLHLTAPAYRVWATAVEKAMDWPSTED